MDPSPSPVAFVLVLLLVALFAVTFAGGIGEKPFPKCAAPCVR